MNDASVLRSSSGFMVPRRHASAASLRLSERADRLMASAFFIAGTIRPRGVSTASPICTPVNVRIESPIKWLLTSGNFFKALVHAYFAHTETKHRLLGPIQTAETVHNTRETLAIGQRVKFEVKGAYIYGTITKINKVNAVVKADDGEDYNVKFYALQNA